MTGQDRRDRLADAVTNARVEAARSGLGSAAWRSLAACIARPDLPWTADPEQVGPWDAESMRDVCRACPVRVECAAYADDVEACSGWWAGQHRDPDYVEPPAPSWVAVKIGRTRIGTGLEQGALPLVLETNRTGAA
jgi:hypothetical protein